MGLSEEELQRLRDERIAWEEQQRRTAAELVDTVPALLNDTYTTALRFVLGEAAGCREVHRRLDAAGVPSARRVACDDPTCQTQAGHRVKVLIGERGRCCGRPVGARCTTGRKNAARR